MIPNEREPQRSIEPEPLAELEPQRPQRIFIANRGVFALDVLEYCHANDIGAVIGVSDTDENNLPARKAKEYGEKDPRYAVAYLGTDNPDDSYKNMDAIINAALAFDCDAVHPKIGFLSEKPAFSRAVRDAGLTFIGPSPEAMTIGDKYEGSKIAERLGIPVARISELINDPEEAVSIASGHGEDDLMIKTKSGGGGAGIEPVKANDADKIRQTVETFINIWGKDEVYLERMIPNARHIEIQVIRDRFGNVVTDARDCSTQVGHQKQLEYAPPQNFPADQIAIMADDAVRMANEVGYVGYKTMEFLVDENGNRTFIEENTRMQVEYPVSQARMEVVDPETGERKPANFEEIAIDLAVGKPLPNIVKNDKTVVEVRINAQNYTDLSAAYGQINEIELPQDPRIQKKFGYGSGDVIPAMDTMLGQLVVAADTFEEAVEILDEGLEHTIITGVPTNIDFQRWAVRREKLKDGTVTTEDTLSEWQTYLTEMGRRPERFWENGEFEEHTKPVEQDVDDPNFPDFTYEHRGKTISYREELRRMHKEFPDHSAFRFGIYTDKSGKRMGLAYMDRNYFGGTIDVEEENAIEAFYQLCEEENIDASIVGTSGGARNPSLRSLPTMAGIANIIAAHPNIFTTLIEYGNDFGGFKAAVDGVVKVRIAVNGAHFGLAGPALTAPIDGYASVKDYPPDHHSAASYFQARQLELIAKDEPDAMKMALTLSEIASDKKTEDLLIPDKKPAAFVSQTPVTRHDRPALHGPAFIRHLGDSFHHNRYIRQAKEAVELFSEKVEQQRQHRERRQTVPEIHMPTMEERWEILKKPSRPSFGQLLSAPYNVADLVQDLGHTIVVGEVVQPTAIAGALARIEDRKFLFLWQETATKADDEGNLVREYPPSGPEDFDWMERMITEIGLPFDFHVVVGAATRGAKADLISNLRGVNSAISRGLVLAQKTGIKHTTVNAGPVGSGGGLPLAYRSVRSLVFSNGIWVVANPEAIKKITSGDIAKEPTEEEVNAVIRQQKDAYWNVEMGYADAVVEEPEGGPENDPELFGKRFREALILSDDFQKDMSQKERIDFALQKQREVRLRGTRPIVR